MPRIYVFKKKGHTAYILEGNAEDVSVVGFTSGQFTGEKPWLHVKSQEDIDTLADGLYRGNLKSDTVVYHLSPVKPDQEIDRLQSIIDRPRDYKPLYEPDKKLRMSHLPSQHSIVRAQKIREAIITLSRLP